MSKILVIGSVSLDEFHLAQGRVQVAGGAGLYSAAAAQRSGAEVTLLALRPEPVPQPLQPAAAHIHWIGPVVSPNLLPRFEIDHNGSGGVRMLHADLGAEADLSPADIPADLAAYDLLHVAGLGNAARQLAFLQTGRRRGARQLSVGTYPCLVHEQTAVVRRLSEEADLFFLNENEARGLFGSLDGAKTPPGKLLFVTLGERGVLVLQGEHVVHVPGLPANVLDPTGAGDSFCGATLANLVAGVDPVMAARRGIALAARVIEAIGPRALWDNAPF
jgi:ribokinase